MIQRTSVIVLCSLMLFVTASSMKKRRSPEESNHINKRPRISADLHQMNETSLPQVGPLPSETPDQQKHSYGETATSNDLMLQHLEHMWDSIAESPKGTVGSEHLGLKMRELEKEMTLDTPHTSIQLRPMNSNNGGSAMIYGDSGGLSDSPTPHDPWQGNELAAIFQKKPSPSLSVLENNAATFAYSNHNMASTTGQHSNSAPIMGHRSAPSNSSLQPIHTNMPDFRQMNQHYTSYGGQPVNGPHGINASIASIGDRGKAPLYGKNVADHHGRASAHEVRDQVIPFNILHSSLAKNSAYFAEHGKLHHSDVPQQQRLGSDRKVKDFYTVHLQESLKTIQKQMDEIIRMKKKWLSEHDDNFAGDFEKMREIQHTYDENIRLLHQQANDIRNHLGQNV